MPPKNLSSNLDKDLVSSDSSFSKTDFLLKTIHTYDMNATESEHHYRLGKLNFLKVHWMYVFYLYRQTSPFIKKYKEEEEKQKYRDKYEEKLILIDEKIRKQFQLITKPNGNTKKNIPTPIREEFDNLNWELAKMHQVFIEILCKKGLWMSWKPNEEKRRTNNQKLQDALMG